MSIEYTPADRFDRRSTAEIAMSAVDYLVRAKLVEVDACVALNEIVLSPAYVVCRSVDRPWFTDTSARIGEHGIRSAGRFGAWDYLSVEGAFLSGISAAAAIPSLRLLEAPVA